MKVYIAAPYTKGDVSVNVGKAIKAGNCLLDYGFIPFVPHLNHFMHMHHFRNYEEWMQYDMEWLEACDAVYRLPGESPGADRECARAMELGIPVFTDGMPGLIHYRNSK